MRGRQDIGGLDIQKQEIREAVELPLTHHELYKQIGIDPPRGVLLYGVPGTGKTMLAKAVAHHTTAAFIRVVGSEFVQKYLGEVRPCSLRNVMASAGPMPCDTYDDICHSSPYPAAEFEYSSAWQRAVRSPCIHDVIWLAYA